MPQLELKIPPVLLMILFGLLMWLVSLILPGVNVPIYLRLSGATILLFSGVFVAVAGVLAFKKAQTTVNPTSPGMATSLVTLGIYQHTRNPMYVGLFLFLLSWGIFLANGYSFVISSGFVLYMNLFQILPEEKALATIFGAEFIDYKQRVRRWL